MELEQTDLMFAFKELYDIIENYIKRIKDSGVKVIKPKSNKLTEFLHQNQYGRWWRGKNPSLGAALNQYIKAGNFNYRRLR